MVLLRDGDEDSTAISDAINEALERTGYNYELVGAVYKEKTAVKGVKQALEKGQSEGYAVLVVPYDDVNYSEAIERSNKLGVPLYFLQSTEPEDITKEVCELYGATKRYYYRDGSEPWNKQSDAVIVVLCRDVDDDASVLYNAVKEALDAQTQTAYRATHREKSSVKTLKKALEDGVGKEKTKLDDVLVIPYDGVDYSEAIRTANELHIPLHFIDPSMTSAEEIEQSILKLYGGNGKN